jgi:hypothetical protein
VSLPRATCAAGHDTLAHLPVKTSLPGNIEDEDLIDGQPFRPQPTNVRTGMSFTLARLKFAEIAHKQIWQANNTHHRPYSFM